MPFQVLRESYDKRFICKELYESSKNLVSRKLNEMDKNIKESTQLVGEVSPKKMVTTEEEFDESRQIDAIPSPKTDTSRKAIVRWYDAFLFVTTGFMFLVTGALLIARIYSLLTVSFFGIDAWIHALAFAIVLTMVSGIRISSKSVRQKELAK